MGRLLKSRQFLFVTALAGCLALFAALCWAANPTPQVVPPPGSPPAPTYSIYQTNTPIADAIRNLFQEAGKKCIFDLPVKGTVTCTAHSTFPFDLALNLLVSYSTAGLSYSIKDGVYHFGPLGTITGKVVPPPGVPAAGFTVVAYPAVEYPLPNQLSSVVNTTRTDAQGNYTIVLRKQPPPSGAFIGLRIGGQFDLHDKGYKVVVTNPGDGVIPPLEQIVDPSTRSDRTIRDVDFALQPSPVVVVKATDAITGAPVPGIAVTYGAPWPSPGELGVTDKNGEIHSVIPTLNTYLHAILNMSPSAEEFAPGYGSGVRASFEMNTSPGKIVTWNLKTYGTERKSNWHGVVLMPDGKPVGAGVSVELLRGQQSYPQGDSTVTDSLGRFSIETYRFDRDETGEFPNSHKPVAFVQYEGMTAAAIVTPDESWDGITLHLMPGASLSGTVVDLQGKPAGYVNATLSGQILGEQEWRYPLPVQPTDAKGHFKIANLPPGEYRVTLSGGGYSDMAIPLRTDEYGRQTPLKLAAGEQKDLGTIADPHADWVLSGQLVDKIGKPAPSMEMKVTGSHTDRVIVADPEGKFRVKNLPPEPLTVQVGHDADSFTKQISANTQQVTITIPQNVIEKFAAKPTPRPASSGAGTPAADKQLRLVATGTSSPLDGLALAIRKESSGLYTCAIIRPNALQPFDGRMQASRWAVGMSALTPIWQGSLADLDGMKFAVRDNHGVLTDRAGRAVWSGTVVDPPDYVISVHRLKSGTVESAVRDSSGNTLWSGAGGAEVTNQSIIAYTPDHKIAWQRGIGNGRVETIGSGDGARPADDWKPFDGNITLHVISENAVVTAQDGNTLLTGAMQAVTFTLTGFPPVPESLIENPGPHPGANARLFNEEVTLPQEFQALLSVQNAPPDSKLTFADSAGKPLGPAFTLNPTPKAAAHMQESQGTTHK